MKHLHRLSLLLLLLLPLSATAQSKKASTLKPTPIYLFGVGTSFNDTTYYVTTIQQLPTGFLAPKTEFLFGQAEYAKQMKKSLESTYAGYETCVVYAATKEKDIEKRYAKMMKHLQKEKGHDIVNLPAAQFSFQLIDTPAEMPAPAEPQKKKAPNNHPTPPPHEKK